MHRVLVYGTLKKGHYNHRLLTDASLGAAKYIGLARTVEKYPLVVASHYNIPCLLYVPGEGENILGEVYDVDDAMLGAMDELEGHPDLYQRDVLQIQLFGIGHCHEGQSQECVTYFLKSFKPELLKFQFYETYVNEPSRPYIPPLARGSNLNIPGVGTFREEVMTS